MRFNPNDIVIKRGDPGRRGRITGLTRPQPPDLLWEVEFGHQERKFIREVMLEQVARQAESLETRIRAGRYAKAEDFRRLITFEKLKGRLHDFFYSMESSKIDFHPYQYKPVLKFIESPHERLVIADEVGLGKTIEAALIWLELRARRDARRLAIICPKMLQVKWQDELRLKFGIKADISNAKDLRDVLKEFKEQQAKTHFTKIFSYTALRPPKDECALGSDEDSAESLNGKLWHQLSNWNAPYPLFDLLIFDEAHYMRNPESATSKLGQGYSEAAQAMLFVSATPVNNKSTDLLTLLRMVDQDFFESEAFYEEIRKENIPVVAACNLLGRGPCTSAAVLKELEPLSASAFLANSPLLETIRNELTSSDPSDASVRSRLVASLERINLLGSYVTRTRKRDIKEDRPVRRACHLAFDLHPEEARLYKLVLDTVRLRVAAQGKKFHFFHLIQPQLRMASSIPAMVDSLLNHWGKDEEMHQLISEVLQDLDHVMNPVLADDLKDMDLDDVSAEFDFKKWLRATEWEKIDSKYNKLRDLLRNPRETDPKADFDTTEKIVLFAFYKGTLYYLRDRLEADGFKCALITGDMEQEHRQEKLSHFENDPTIRILLSSEVGSEGIDLQFARILINYDLPWNPMRVEQRIGRIDRLKQKSQTLIIVNFKAKGTLEELVYDKLYLKLEFARQTLGDFEEILGEQVESLSRRLLGRHLTKEEAARQIDATALALENKIKVESELEEQGSNLVAHGDFIQDRISESHRLGRYLTASDIRAYIADFFARSFRGCVLEWDNPVQGAFRLKLNPEALESYQDHLRVSGLDHYAAVSLRGDILATCHPELAEQHRQLLLVNHFHPMIRWITEHNKNQSGAFYNLVALQLQSSLVAPGDWWFTVQRWEFQGLRKTEMLVYAALNMNTDEVLNDGPAEALVQEALKLAGLRLDPLCSAELAIRADERLKEVLGQCLQQRSCELEAENSNMAKIKLAQLEGRLLRKTRSLEKSIETMRERNRTAGQIQSVITRLSNFKLEIEHQTNDLRRKAEFDYQIEDVCSGTILVKH